MNYAIILPTSKSILIRQLVDGFVRTGKVMTVSPDECDDVQVTSHALYVIQKHLHKAVACTVTVNDCGTAYRFLTALLAVTPGNWQLTGTPRLLERPMTELVETLNAKGASIRFNDLGLHIVGTTLQVPEMTIDCARCSQFASALLLIAPKIGLKTLHIQPMDFSSASFVQLTRSCIGSVVSVPQLPQPSQPVGRVGDWSAAVFWYAQALLHPENSYKLAPLSLVSIQGDSVVAHWFAELGVQSTETDEGVFIKSVARNQPFVKVYDMAEHLDLVPVMASLGTLLPADFTFLHTRNLQYKESNRGRALAEQLRPFCNTVDLQEDSLHVIGNDQALWPSPPYSFSTFHDHRLAMAFLLFGSDAHLDDIACLSKSYPKLALL